MSSAENAKPLELPLTTMRDKIKPVLTRRGKRDVIYVDLTGTYHESWAPLVANPEYTFERLLETLYRNGYSAGFRVFPYPNEVLSAFQVPVTAVKVIIVAQDPYPGWDAVAQRPVACGKSFATLSKECPGSLKRIMIALQEKYTDRKITYADKEHPYSLKGWTDQGVLLLNRTPVYYSSANPEAPKPDTLPKDIWSGMVELVYRYVSNFNPNVPCILIGKEAQELEPKLGKCYKENHPSMRSSLHFSGDCFDRVSEIDWTHM